MVGTGRIELPTSSVSRKRSPTELRACKTEQEWPQQVDLPSTDRITWVLYSDRTTIVSKQGKRSILLPIFRRGVNWDDRLKELDFAARLALDKGIDSLILWLRERLPRQINPRLERSIVWGQ
jgi:hypothetical protein